MRNQLLRLASLLTLGLSASGAVALPCVGFTDLEDTSSFCPNVEWLKNRAITLGCTSTTTYCPSDPVTRLSMAVFMNRLGKALTPVTLHKEALALNIAIGNPPSVHCVTDDLPAAAYPRTARFAGSVFGVPATYGGTWLQGWWKYSIDQGTTWEYVGTWQVTQFYGRDWADGGQVVGFPVFAPPMNLAAGSAYRFGLFLNGNGQTYTFQSVICAADVTITNSNPATSPFDAD